MLLLAVTAQLAALFAFHSSTTLACGDCDAKKGTQSQAVSLSGSFGTLQQTYYPPNADCVDYMIPINIVSDNFVFNYTKWESDYDLEDFISIATTRVGAMYPTVLEGPKTENATYKIAASFCTPKVKLGKEKTVILATHGIGPARSHWNSPYKPNDYNFVQWAAGQGYSVFFYDRLGTGASQKISGFKNQISISIAILQELSDLIRAGKYTGALGKPDKVAVIGFSYGSLTTHGAIAARPEIADAVILTAIGFNTTGINLNGLVRSFVPRIANLQNPRLYGDRDTGYVTWVDKFAQIHNYFKKPNYDIATADFAELAKEPFAITEFLTLYAGPQDASNYTKPVLAITGDTDYILCDGYCKGIFDEPAATLYKNAKPFKRVLHPGVSHNINFHHNATGAYNVITGFLKENGL